MVLSGGRPVLAKILSSVIALSLAFSPMSASAADTIYFRYKPKLISAVASPGDPNNPTTPTTPTDPGTDPGTDQPSVLELQARFMTVVGDEFEATVPGADARIASWKTIEGSLPAGLFLDDATGDISGTAVAAEQATILLSGLDGNDKEISRAKVTVAAVQMEGVANQGNFYLHVGTPFETSIPEVDEVSIFQWDPVGSLPPGLALNARTGLIEGLPTKSGSYTVAFRGVNEEGVQFATFFGTFLVESGPTIEFIENQRIDLNLGEQFDVNPVVRNSLGPLQYRLLSLGDDYAGIDFNDVTGRITGAFDLYSTSARYRIEARDTADGTIGLSNVFTLSTDRLYFNVSGLPNQYGSIGTAFEIDLKSRLVTNASGKVVWSVIGNLPDGLSIDPETGRISGVPTRIETTNLQVRATLGSDSDTSSIFKFQIVQEPLFIKGPSLTVVPDTPFATDAIAVVTGDRSGLTFASSLHEGFSIDSNTGVISSAGVEKTGRFDHTVVATDVNGQTASTTVRIAVRPAGTPTFPETTTVERLKFAKIVPSVPANSTTGFRLFEVVEGTLPSFAKLDAERGFITLQPVEAASVGVFGPFRISLTDSLGIPFLSNPFTFTITDRPALVVNANEVTIPAYVFDYTYPVKVAGQQGATQYELIEGQSSIPEGLSWISANGHFRGKVNLSPGTVLKGFKLRVTDSKGGVGEFGPFDLTVTAPEGLKSLYGKFDKSMAWTENHPLKPLALTRPTNAYGPLVYALGQGTPAGLSVVEGNLTGTVAQAGNYAFPYTVTDDVNRQASGMISLDIRTQPSVVLPPLNLQRGISFDIPARVLGGIPPYKISLGPDASLPSGVNWSVQKASFYGRPQVEGDFNGSLLIQDASGATADTGPLSITVVPGPQMSFSYPSPSITVQKNVNASVRPTIVGGSGSYNFAISSGTLPKGAELFTKSHAAGNFNIKATELGSFPFKVTGTDVYYGTSQTVDLTVNVVPAATFTVTAVSPTTRVGTTVSFAAPKVTNAIGSVVYSATGLNDTGLSISSTTGVVSGKPIKAGIISAVVTAKDSANRNASVEMVISVVDNLAVSMDDGDLYYGKTVVQANMKQPAVTGAVGAPTWKINNVGNLPPGVDFNATVGRFDGMPTALGRYGPLTITVTDSLGSASSWPIYLTVQMNTDPIGLNVSGAVTKVGMSVSNPAPAYSNSISGTRFIARNLGGTNLSLNSATGVFTGSFSTAGSYDIDLTITDNTGRETTKTVTFDVKPKMTVAAPDTVTLDAGVAMDPVVASRSNTFGTATWDNVTSGLPPGVIFNTSTGQFEGTPTSSGTFGPVKITGRDSLNDSATSSGTTFVVRTSGHVYWRILDTQTQGNYWYNASGNAISDSYNGPDIPGVRYQGWGAMNSKWYDDTGRDVTSLKIKNPALPSTGYNVSDAIWAVSGFMDNANFQLKKENGAWYKTYKFSEKVNIGRVEWTFVSVLNDKNAILYPVIQHSDDGVSWTTSWSDTLARSSLKTRGTQKP
jgi:hypothetical protein